MNQPPNERDLERIIHTVTDEVLGYLGLGAHGREAGGSTSATASGHPTWSRSAPDTRQASIAALLDHTLLRADAHRAEIINLCSEATHFGFATVCVNPWYVPLAEERTRGSNVKVCTVVGFPLGASLPRTKIQEAEEAIKLGAREIDVVQNIGAFKSGQEEQVEADLRGVVDACHRGGAICKVILETALLSAAEKMRSAQLAQNAGADFVKTSTGFSSAGATAEDVALLRSVVGPAMGIKAAGGIRNLADVERMLRAGATRIGASASVNIMGESAITTPGEQSDSS